MHKYSNLGDYEIVEKLGSGSFGYVFKARHRITQQIYAIKVIDQGRLIANNVMFSLDYINREVKVLKKLSHPNIVGLTDYLIEGDNHILVMEYCSGPTLDQYIAKRRLSEETTRQLLKQLAAGLKYMWSKNIIHRDLKPQNILFSTKGENAQLKIIDFGFSRMRTQNLMTSMVGTPIYMAPELLRNQPYSAKSDLWSVGCIMYEMLTGNVAFTCNMYHELMQLHASWAGPSLSNASALSPACRDLLAGLMCADPIKRIDWNDFFSHPFICSPNLLAETLINVRIEPLSRNVTLNTKDIDTSLPVSVLKAQLLTDMSDDAEKYDGVAALLEADDGNVVEMLDSNTILHYLDKLLNASAVYLVLPLNKEEVPDIAAKPISELMSTLKPILETEEVFQSVNEKDIKPDDMQLLVSLHSDFSRIEEEITSFVRQCRKGYDIARALVENRSSQFKALKASLKVLAHHTKEITELSVSFKKTFQDPQEDAMLSLPLKVEANIAELRTIIVEQNIPGLQGKSLLDCVGEAKIRQQLRECQAALAESRQLMESFDLALKDGYLDPKILDLLQKELDYDQLNLKRMQTELQAVETKQEFIAHWAVQVYEHMSASTTSWLGFSFADPLREALEHSRVLLTESRASTREVYKLIKRIGGRDELWPTLVSQFRTIANARTSVFSAMKTLHVCGEQYYEPQQHVIRELERLPEVLTRLTLHAAQVAQARNSLEGNIQTAVRNADDTVQTMRNGILDQIKNFHQKFEKQQYARTFIDAVQTLAPPLAHIALQTTDDQSLRANLAMAQQHNAQLQQYISQLRAELQSKNTEVAALAAHGRDLSAKLNEEQKLHREQSRVLEEKLVAATRTNFKFPFAK